MKTWPDSSNQTNISYSACLQISSTPLLLFLCWLCLPGCSRGCGKVLQSQVYPPCQSDVLLAWRVINAQLLPLSFGCTQSESACHCEILCWHLWFAIAWSGKWHFVNGYHWAHFWKLWNKHKLFLFLLCPCIKYWTSYTILPIRPLMLSCFVTPCIPPQHLTDLKLLKVQAATVVEQVRTALCSHWNVSRCPEGKLSTTNILTQCVTLWFRLPRPPQ